VTTALRWTTEQLAEYEQRRGRTACRTQPEPPMPGVDIDAIHHKRGLVETESKLERRFGQQIIDGALPTPQRNYFFLPDRDLELDFAWPGIKVYVEVQGMSHRIKGKFKRDIEKRALALLSGWRGLEVDGSAIRDGRAIRWLQQLLEV
jgi:hypothetical protein